MTSETRVKAFFGDISELLPIKKIARFKALLTTQKGILF